MLLRAANILWFRNGGTKEKKKKKTEVEVIEIKKKKANGFVTWMDRFRNGNMRGRA